MNKKLQSFSFQGRALDISKGITREQIFDHAVSQNHGLTQLESTLFQQVKADKFKKKPKSESPRDTMRKFQGWCNNNLNLQNISYVGRRVKNRSMEPSRLSDIQNETALNKKGKDIEEYPKAIQKNRKPPEKIIDIAFGFRQNHQETLRSETIQSDRKAPSVVGNVMQYMTDKNRLRPRRAILEDERFKTNFRRNMGKYRPANSSVNPEVELLRTGVSFLSTSFTPMSRMSLQDSLRIPNQNRITQGSPFTKTEYKTKYHHLVSFIATKYEENQSSSKVCLKQINQLEEDMKDELQMQKQRLSEDVYDYEYQIKLSFMKKEQKDTLQEVKRQLLSQMPVSMYGMSPKNLLKQKFKEHRIQKNFPVTDIFKHLYEHHKD